MGIHCAVVILVSEGIYTCTLVIYDSLVLVSLERPSSLEAYHKLSLLERACGLPDWR